MFKLWLFAFRTKASNPSYTETAKNPGFDLLMTSNDYQIEHV